MTRLCLALVLTGCGSPAATGNDFGMPDDLAPADLASPDLAASSDFAPAPPDLEPGPCVVDTDGGTAPSELRCTGLYSDWATRTIDSANLPYAPAFELWSDGAQKKRWMYLPPGGKIDVSDLNEWTFPVGTKFWKEFDVPQTAGGVKPVETRLLWKVAPGAWTRISYQWSSDLSRATELAAGMMNVPGTNNYEIPARPQCNRCHNGRKDGILGLETVETAAPGATGLTWTMLQSMGLLTSTNGNDLLAASTLQIPGTPTESAALGYLHANCGISCHNGNVNLLLRMRLETIAGNTYGAVSDAPVYKTGINVLSSYQAPMPPAPTGNLYRIRPTDDTRSMIYYRSGVRDATGGFAQMPPVDTHVVDTAGHAIIDAWINYMTVANGYPAPAAP